MDDPRRTAGPPIGPVQVVTVTTGSPEETRGVGAQLAALLGAGARVLLRGPLGAGKTCFVQGMARGLGVPPEYRVTSQTFTLYGVYPGRLPLYHFDAYRIQDPAELVAWGDEALFGGDGVAVVEWGERLGRLLPEPVLRVRIEPRGPQDRRIRIYGPARDFGSILDEFPEEA